MPRLLRKYRQVLFQLIDDDMHKIDDFGIVPVQHNYNTFNK